MSDIFIIVQQFGARWGYLCSRKQKQRDMKNTDYSLELLGNMISSDTGFEALKDLIEDLGLEMEDALEL